MLYNIPFVSPIPQLNGIGTVKLLGEKFAAFNCKKVMLMYDKGVEATGIPMEIDKVIKESGISTIHYNNIQTDPPDTICHEAAQIARDEDIDGIIAIGGGSAMDTGKAVKLLKTNPGVIQDYLDDYNFIPDTPSIPLVVIPTTAGTGAEASRGGVITDTVAKRKGVIIGPAIMADFAVIDPELTIGLPPRITAATAFDAMAHLMGAMYNKKTDATTQEICIRGLELFQRSLTEVYYNGQNNLDARADMATAANLGGLALVSASCTMDHAFGHSIGAYFEHHFHGETVAWMEPACIECAADAMPEETRKIAEAMHIHIGSGDTPVQIAQKIGRKIVALAKSVNMPPIQSICATPEEMYPIIPMAQIDPQGFNSVIEITDEVGKWVIDRTFEYWSV